MRSSKEKESLVARPARQSELFELLQEYLCQSRTDAMFEGFGNAFNMFPNEDHRLKSQLKRLIADRYGTYLDWATIGEALWEAVDELQESLDEEQLAQLDSKLRSS